MGGVPSLTDAVKRAAAGSLTDAIKNAAADERSGEGERCSSTDCDEGPPGDPSSTLRVPVSRVAARQSVVSRTVEMRSAPGRGHLQIPAAAERPGGDLRRVFVVHGHDEAAKVVVARFLEQMQFEAIVLNEQANRGRTIIEKLEAYRDVGFAVVLLTPDDACSAGGKSTRRARQNVILELGYFVGVFGRGGICVLRKGDVELPSDMLGVVTTELDSRGAWRLDLARELKAAGYDIGALPGLL